LTTPALVALATPSAGVVNVGEVESTTLPDPVEVVVPVPPLATGSAPVTPLVNGKPVALVNTTALGVPSAGVVNVGEVESTTLPDPVAVVAPVPPLATGIAASLPRPPADVLYTIPAVVKLLTFSALVATAPAVSVLVPGSKDSPDPVYTEYDDPLLEFASSTNSGYIVLLVALPPVT
jgi:hypothetical protein